MHRLWFGYLGGNNAFIETIVGELLLLCPVASGRRGRGSCFTETTTTASTGSERGGYKSFRGRGMRPSPPTRIPTRTGSRLGAASRFHVRPDLAVSGEDIGVPQRGRLGAVVVGGMGGGWWEWWRAAR